MANTYKDIIITPQRSSDTNNPKIEFRGGNTTSNTVIVLTVNTDSNGTIAYTTNTGSDIFVIKNDQTNLVFGTYTTSNTPILECYANGQVSIGNSTVNTVITANGIIFSDNTAGDGARTSQWDESAMGVITALARGWALP